MDRKPVVAIAVSGFLAISATGAAMVAGATSASADAPVGETVPATLAPAGRVMGGPVLGMDGSARVHSVKVDIHGAAQSYTIEQRTGLFGRDAEFIRIDADDLAYLPARNALVVVPAG